MHFRLAKVKEENEENKTKCLAFALIFQAELMETGVYLFTLFSLSHSCKVTRKISLRKFCTECTRTRAPQKRAVPPSMSSQKLKTKKFHLPP